MKLLAAIVVVALPFSAFADDLPPSTAELQGAMAQCNLHHKLNPTAGGAFAPSKYYEPGWESCLEIKAALDANAGQERDKADQQTINDMIKRLAK